MPVITCSCGQQLTVPHGVSGTFRCPKCKAVVEAKEPDHPIDFHVPDNPAPVIEESALAALLEIAGWVLFAIFGVALPLIITNTVLVGHEPGWHVPAFFVCCLASGFAMLMFFRFLAAVARFIDKSH